MAPSTDWNINLKVRLIMNLEWHIASLFFVLTDIEPTRLFFKDENNSLGIQILNLKLIYSRKTLSRTMCHRLIYSRMTVVDNQGKIS